MLTEEVYEIFYEGFCFIQYKYDLLHNIEESSARKETTQQISAIKSKERTLITNVESRVKVSFNGFVHHIISDNREEESPDKNKRNVIIGAITLK